MVFSDLVFLCLFMPVTVGVCYLLPKRWRNGWLLFASLVFYGWGEPRYLLLMAATIATDYAAGRWLASAGTPAHRRLVMTGAVALNIGLLIYFKYADLLIGTFNALLKTGLPLVQVVLPVGISFYTFQALSYVIDVYRGTVEPQRDLVRFAMYVTLFPQLIAGPIVRYKDIQDQLDQRPIDWEAAYEGVQRFIVGLGKKVIVANQLGLVYRQLAALDPSQVTMAAAWWGAVCFALQIYFDFSGYSDMAIGLGRMLGFTFPENFRYPYTAVSVTDFWRRWHMTLSSWFKEYVYIPLGGSRRGRRRQVLNLLIVWALTGLWHGASWNFLLWGLYFFLLLTMEKLWFGRVLDTMPPAVGRLYTAVAVTVGWVIFNGTDMAWLTGWLAALVGRHGLADATALYHMYTSLPLVLAAGVGATPLPHRIYERLMEVRPMPSVVCAAGALLLAACLALVVGGSYDPFLYFRF